MGNILTCFKKEKPEYASFINDNLLLSNIQERLEEYDDKVKNINLNVVTLRDSYGTMVKNLREEISDMKKDYSYLEQKHNKLNDNFRNLNLENKTQESKIAELETKMEQIENEKIFLERSIDITESSRYVDPESQFNA